MELVSFDSYFLELVVGDFSRLLVLVSVEPSVHFKTLFGGRRTNEVNDDLQVFERNALPVASDVAEQTVLDLVPLARPWGIVA